MSGVKKKGGVGWRKDTVISRMARCQLRKEQREVEKRKCKDGGRCRGGKIFEARGERGGWVMKADGAAMWRQR